MNIVRKLVLAASFLLTLVFSSCAPVAAREGNGAATLGGYEYVMPDGVVVLSTAPCRESIVQVPVPPVIQAQLKLATATEHATGRTVELCWYAHADGDLVIVGPQGPFTYIPINDPRLVRRAKI